jgi:hypothetical protein
VKALLRPHARIIGVDINAGCKKFEEDQIHFRIGAQEDVEFLSSIIEECGAPDIVLNDGSHRMSSLQLILCICKLRGGLSPTAFTRNTLAMHYHDSVIVFERGRSRKMPLLIGRPRERG